MFWHWQIIAFDVSFWFLPELLIYKTTAFANNWNTENLESLSQCSILLLDISVRQVSLLTWMSSVSLSIFDVHNMNTWKLKNVSFATVKGKNVNCWEPLQKYVSLNNSGSIHVKKVYLVREYALIGSRGLIKRSI